MTHEEIEELAQSGRRWKAHDGSEECPVPRQATINVVYADGYSETWSSDIFTTKVRFLGLDWAKVVGWRYD